MVIRKDRKKHKLRGNRTHGKGNTKNNRGAGCRGGRGRAGSHKHKFTKYWMDFGQKRRLKAKNVAPPVKLDFLEQQLEKWVEKGIVEKKDSEYIVDGKKIGYSKILGTGSINSKVVISNMAASASAREKIEAAGGKVKVVEKGEKAFDEELNENAGVEEESENSEGIEETENEEGVKEEK